ncbi:MAG: ShlB/FhaC/HecB family hemolysin secretion/activation protein, partial [Comamonadaceae bacterium]
MPRRAVALACLALVASWGAKAQPAPSAPRPFIEEIRQQERERALREQQERGFDALQPAPPKTDDKRLPETESPCFRIDRLVLGGERAEDFQWALSSASGPKGDDTPIGRCLGTEGVNVVLARLQQAVIARGWVTTRVLAAPQDLTQGTLTLSLVPGRIAQIRVADDASTKSWLPTLCNACNACNAIPARPGDLLNLRDIEQGLENLKRLPTAEADIQIEPSKAADARPGNSDLVVKYAQKLPLRTTLSLDDSGTQATGKLQAGATVAWDNPLGLNDLFYVSLNHDAFNHKGSGTAGQTVHY